MKNTVFRTLLLILAVWTGAPAGAEPVLENRGLRVEVRPSDASVTLLDKKTGVSWTLGPPLIIREDGGKSPARPAGKVTRQDDFLRYSSSDGTEFRLRITDDPPAAEYSFEPASGVQEVELFHEALPLEPGEENYYAVPHRLGILIPVEGDKPFTRRMRAYETGRGYSMAMFGAVKNGSALLVTWEDPYTDILVHYSVKPARQLTMGLAMRRSARFARLQPLGRGGYVEIAKAYRPVARRRGFLKTLAEKVRENPDVARIFGAADFRPFVFVRLAPNTRWNPREREVIRRNFTFEETAELAEHFKNDLGIDRALLVLAGWINGGYDTRHPDILPAAPEIGGNDGLIACSRRVKALGWLFGLHDNYQDMYKDAPSWDESYIMKKRDGSLRKGGVWYGGQAWLICSKKSVELASRPQNVPGVKKLFDPDVYFSDTIFAAPLYECFDPAHPLTLVEDILYKQKLCDYIRGEIGLFGSEEGREWGVAHSDYFEGLMSHKTRRRRADQKEIIIPLFELVFSDAIPLYAHLGDRPRPDNPTYILDHVLYAEMPNYFFGKHRYWMDPARDFRPKPGSEARLIFAQGGRFGLIDQFIKNTYEVLSPLHRLTAFMEMTDHRFLTRDRQVEMTRFGADVEIVVNYGPKDFATSDAVLPQYGFLVKSPTLVGFCARRYHGVSYSEPTLFVLRSMDGKPLASSDQVRVYRGFGGRRVELGGAVLEVDTEKIVGKESSQSEVLSAEPATERTEVIARYEDLHYGMFINFGMMSLAGQHYSKIETNPLPPPETYNPKNLDVDQWIRVAKQAGMRYAVLDVKGWHGFGLWDSKYTDYDVAASPNKTDVVGEFVKACRKYGIAPSLNYSFVDVAHRRDKGLTEDEWYAFMDKQLEELFARYGPFTTMWFDGMKGGYFPEKRIRHAYELVKSLQPDCLVVMHAPGRYDRRLRRWPTDVYQPGQSLPPPEGHNPWMEHNGKTYYIPMEVIGWLTTPGENRIERIAARPLPEIIKTYRNARSRGVNLTMVVWPGRDGRLPADQVERLMELREATKGMK